MSPMGCMQPFVFLVPAPAVPTTPVNDATRSWGEIMKVDGDEPWEPVPEPAAEEAGHAAWRCIGPDPAVRAKARQGEARQEAAALPMAMGQGQCSQALPAAGYVTCNGMQYALVPVAPQPYPVNSDYPMQPPPTLPAPTQAGGQQTLPPPPLHEAADFHRAELSYGSPVGGDWPDKSQLSIGGGPGLGQKAWF
uniref:Uncharacterized protein n=1 Tax=Alexandrium andersonii TaxID=327968 RepID=A0A7S2JHL8_9DINO